MCADSEAALAPAAELESGAAARKQMRSLLASLTVHKDSIARATAFAVMHAKRGGGAAEMTELIAGRVQQVRGRAEEGVYLHAPWRREIWASRG